MKTITEDYVSFEIAKLLKEKGFNEECRARYDSNGALHYEKYPIEASGAEMYNSILCPTHQMVVKWLRKVHNILLFILPAQENGKLVYLVEVWTCNEEEGIYESTYATTPRKEPEQTVEAALKYCLENLI